MKRIFIALILLTESIGNNHIQCAARDSHAKPSLKEEGVSLLNAALKTTKDPKKRAEYLQAAGLTREMLVDQADTKNALGNLPIHEAAAHGSTTSLEKLIPYIQKTKKPWLTARNNDQETPLHLAAKHGHFECASMLAQAQPVALKLKDCRGKFPHEVARENGHQKIAGFLETKYKQRSR